MSNDFAFCGGDWWRYQRPVGGQETNLEEGGAVRKHPQVQEQRGVGPVAEIVAAQRMRVNARKQSGEIKRPAKGGSYRR